MNKKKVKNTTKKNQQMASKLRIISGEWRSRQLPIPNVENLRPTPNRVRETLFNWINHFVPGSRCADLFCGSGALGLEAISRGAKDVLFVDQSKLAIQQMMKNLSVLKMNNAKVIQKDAKEFLSNTTPHPLDIIFIDPPFRKNWIVQIIPLLEKGWLADRTLVYIEMEKETPLSVLPHWSLLREKEAGQLIYRLFKIIKPHI